MDPYSKLQELHQSLEKMTASVASLENDILEALKENTELKVENQLLREKLNKPQAKQAQASSQAGLKSVRKIYDAGYHICNIYYGTHRDPNSDCIFCLEVLSRLSDQKTKDQD